MEELEEEQDLTQRAQRESTENAEERKKERGKKRPLRKAAATKAGANREGGIDPPLRGIGEDGER